MLHVVDQPVHLSSHFTGYGILVSRDACIPMPCIQILSGHLQAPQHLAMFIVVGGTFPWVQFSPRTQPMQIFPCLFLMFCHYFFPLAYDVFSLFSFSISLSLFFLIFFCNTHPLMPNSVYTLSYTWQTWRQERVFCFAQRNILFCNWHCMMMAYGLQQLTLLYADGQLKDVTLKRFFREAVHSWLETCPFQGQGLP